MMPLQVSASVTKRFDAAWESLLPIGLDSTTHGYRRYAWTPADVACRAWFQKQARDRGLTVERDAGGNLLAWWDDFLDRYCHVVAVDTTIARTAGHLRGVLQAGGRPRTQADMLIAATALVLSAPLVTNNAKDYRHLGNLQLVSAAG